MAFRAEFQKRIFHFGFDARTSRGQMRERHCWFLTIHDEKNQIKGVGEAAPLPGLSIETSEEVEQQLQSICDKINMGLLIGKEFNALEKIQKLFPDVLSSSVRTALEMALLDLSNGGKKIIFYNTFARRASSIPTNGLIWIGGLDSMLQQISIKIDEGYRTLKIKIGSLDFDKEIDILQYIKRKYFRENITIRLDANGAFKPHEALYKLNQLAQWNIHSIEQPIMPNQHELMAELCVKSPVPIALDEDVLGVLSHDEKALLLNKIKPQFIILKPSLTGGFSHTQEWIQLAENHNIGWWITSALESSIGLNAVAQFTAQYPVNMPQGLGTGKIYTDNILSPLQVNKQGELRLDVNSKWDDELTDEERELLV
jgi:o-succinylbenzoate synthase